MERERAELCRPCTLSLSFYELQDWILELSRAFQKQDQQSWQARP